MPARSQTLIRRDINRLNDVVQRHKTEQPALAAIETAVNGAANSVNGAWQAYQQAAITGDKEREERDTAITHLKAWIRRWRPVVLMLVPGADENIYKIKGRASTPDDLIRVAGDIKAIIEEKGNGLQSALEDLGDMIPVTEKETSEATAALPAEADARHVFSEACLAANPVVVRGSEIVRAIFGRTSPEYKQFIARGSRVEEETLEVEIHTGETAG